MQSRGLSLAVIGVACLLIAACGGGGDKAAEQAPIVPLPGPGDALDAMPTKVADYSANDLLARLPLDDLGRQLARFSYTPRCDIHVYRLTYRTIDARGAPVVSTGALMVPAGGESRCSGARSIVMYAHGTSTDRRFDITNLDAPINPEGLMVATAFAADGYIVVAPNYIGYGSSTAAHAYLVADQQSREMIDALSAARAALPLIDNGAVRDSGKLFITGYSQGGYVAMATQRAMEVSGASVTATVPMSGPYALAAFGDAIFQGQVSASSPTNVALLVSAYQNAYGTVYSAPSQTFEATYAAAIEGLLPNESELSVLQSQGRIPRDALFARDPPTAAFAGVTPATNPSEFAQVFARGFGTDNLVTNAFRLAYLEDAGANPDGGFPVLSDGLPPAAVENGLRAAFVTNDLRNWVPIAPTLLCGGNADPTVFFLNTMLMQSYWSSRSPSITPVVLDVDSTPDRSDAYASVRAGFLAAKDALRTEEVLSGASDNGDAAVLSNYHSRLVPVFCVMAAKSFFDAN